MRYPETAPFLLVPSGLGPAVDAAPAAWGWLDFKADGAERLFAVAGYRIKDTHHRPVAGVLEKHHFMSAGDLVAAGGVWYKASPGAVGMYYEAIRRNLNVPTYLLEASVEGGWRSPPSDVPMPVLCRSVHEGNAFWSGWWVTTERAVPAEFTVVEDSDPIEGLEGPWPVGLLRGARVAVVGLGSIGSTAAESLATAGTGYLTFIDFDRLLHHNLPRHRLPVRDLGQHKVTALRDALQERYPSTKCEAVVADVAYDADLVRAILARTDLVVCAADGVLARRVTNHLARRAGVPLVLSAVLEDGAFGEIVRVSPRTGCLLCLRRTLEEDGTFNPEPNLDRGYAEGGGQQPMTAAPPDLRLMGELAAKAAIGTLLEAHGFFNQRLPGDWAVIGLQPSPEMPAPFDVAGAGDIRWHDLPRQRDDCPTCAAP